MALDQIDVDNLPDNTGGDMSFLDHLESLRWHLLRSAAAIAICGLGVFLAKDFVFNEVIFGPRHKNFFTFRLLCGLSDATCFELPAFQVVTREISEMFSMHLMVSVWLGLVLAAPYVLWEIWRFLRPGLKPTEQRAARGFVLICTGLFFTGVLFGYYIVAPLAIIFLAGYQIEGVTATPTLSSYVDSMVMFTLPIGLIFELPIVIYFLTVIGLMSSQYMKNYRRHAIVILLIVAGIVTPSPDIASQLLVFIPLYGLYEASIIVAKRVEKRAALEEQKNALPN